MIYPTLFETKPKAMGGYTPLHIAVENKDKEMVMFLKQKGADAQLKNQFHQTPLELAQSLYLEDIVAVLSQ